jgi:hypothetical protein
MLISFLIITLCNKEGLCLSLPHIEISLIIIQNLKRINVDIITSTNDDKSEQILTQNEGNEAPFVKLKQVKR